MEKGTSMDDRTHAVRAMLRSMCPSASIPYIKQFQLPEEEELVLIECDARGKSVQQVAQSMNLSPETVWRRRRAGLLKISRGRKEVNYEEIPLSGAVAKRPHILQTLTL